MRIIALDIGSEQTRCALAEIEYNNNSLDILGFSQAKSLGVKSGTIIDPNNTKKIIEQVIDNVIDQAIAKYKDRGLSSDNFHISCIWVGINGGIQNFDEDTTTYSVNITSGKITENDINRLHKESISGIDLEQNKHIFFKKPIAYYVDDNRSVAIDYPATGLVANKLSLALKVFAISTNDYSNIDECLPPNIRQEFVPSSFASASACVSLDMQETGCVLVNIGRETTHFCIIEQKNILHASSIPLGSQKLTVDIAKYFHISHKEAERIKITHGSLLLNETLDSSTLVTINNDSNEAINISQGRLNDVMSVAFDYIISELFNAIKEQELAEYSKFFVFTGKITNTLGLIERTTKTLEKLQEEENKHHLPSSTDGYSKKILNQRPNIKCSIGSPNNISKDQTYSMKNICKEAEKYNLLLPENSVIAGLLILAFKNYLNHKNENTFKTSNDFKSDGILKKVRKRLKRFV